MTLRLDIDGKLAVGIARRCRCSEQRVDTSDRVGRAHGYLVTHGLLMCQVPYGELTR